MLNRVTANSDFPWSLISSFSSSLVRETLAFITRSLERRKKGHQPFNLVFPRPAFVCLSMSQRRRLRPHTGGAFVVVGAARFSRADLAGGGEGGKPRRRGHVGGHLTWTTYENELVRSFVAWKKVRKKKGDYGALQQ